MVTRLVEAHQVIRFYKVPYCNVLVHYKNIPLKRIHTHTSTHTHSHTSTHTHTHTHTHMNCNRPMALQFKLLTNIKF